MAEAQPINMHATTVAYEGRGVLITGASGSGKSALGLMLMAMGCRLVADDRTLISREGEQVIARCPAPLCGMIEARGVGILASEALTQAALALVVDLDRTEQERLPPARFVTLLEHQLPLLHNVATGHFAAAVLQYLKAGRRS